MRPLGHVLADSKQGRTGDATRRDAETIARSGPFQVLVRAGFIARGITYGTIGILALTIAAGGGTLGAAPSQQGALALIARPLLGRAALVVICAGLMAYALWKLTQGILGRARREAALPR